MKCREKNTEINSIRELRGNFSWLNIHVIKVPNKENKGINIFEEIMAGTFPNLIKHINPYYWFSWAVITNYHKLDA